MMFGVSSDEATPPLQNKDKRVGRSTEPTKNSFKFNPVFYFQIARERESLTVLQEEEGPNFSADIKLYGICLVGIKRTGISYESYEV